MKNAAAVNKQNDERTRCILSDGVYDEHRAQRAPGRCPALVRRLHPTRPRKTECDGGGEHPTASISMNGVLLAVCGKLLRAVVVLPAERRVDRQSRPVCSARGVVCSRLAHRCVAVARPVRRPAAFSANSVS